MGDFRKLAVWKKAHEVALLVYKQTSQWPRHELYGLTSQTRRAAVSVPANIAEGCGKNTDAELAKHARSSLGSAAELAYYMILAHDLGYLAGVPQSELSADIAEVQRMTASLERVAATAAQASSPSPRLRRKS